jgi:hypothetical protein
VPSPLIQSPSHPTCHLGCRAQHALAHPAVLPSHPRPLCYLLLREHAQPPVVPFAPYRPLPATPCYTSARAHACAGRPLHGGGASPTLASHAPSHVHPHGARCTQTCPSLSCRRAHRAVAPIVPTRHPGLPITRVHEHPQAPVVPFTPSRPPSTTPCYASARVRARARRPLHGGGVSPTLASHAPLHIHPHGARCAHMCPSPLVPSHPPSPLISTCRRAHPPRVRKHAHAPFAPSHPPRRPLRPVSPRPPSPLAHLARLPSPTPCRTRSPAPFVLSHPSTLASRPHCTTTLTPSRGRLAHPLSHEHALTPVPPSLARPPSRCLDAVSPTPCRTTTRSPRCPLRGVLTRPTLASTHLARPPSCRLGARARTTPSRRSVAPNHVPAHRDVAALLARCLLSCNTDFHFNSYFICTFFAFYN